MISLIMNSAVGYLRKKALDLLIRTRSLEAPLEPSGKQSVLSEMKGIQSCAVDFKCTKNKKKTKIWMSLQLKCKLEYFYISNLAFSRHAIKRRTDCDTKLRNFLYVPLN